jgi:hypothetical protein
MSNEPSPPLNCTWWATSDPTPNPPQDRDFLVALVRAGFRTFIATRGLTGALCGERMVDIIHRGFGRRWEMGFIQSGKEEWSAIVEALPTHAGAAIAWLNGKPIEDVKVLIGS